MLVSAVLQSVILWLTTGIFYSGFLVAYNINIVNIGLITTAQYASSVFGIFSPYILRRFARRRCPLAFMKSAYYIFNIAGVTLLPQIVRSDAGRTSGLAAIVFVSGILNSITLSGYGSWQMNFLEQEHRADYFLVSQFGAAFFPGIVLLISGAVADSASGSAASLNVLLSLRWLAFVCACADVFFLSRPAEYPYPDSGGAPKLADIFRCAFSSRKFMLTMLLVFVWQVSDVSYPSFFNVYLLKSVGVPYFFYNLIIALYAPFFIFCSHFWKREIYKHSWLGVWAAGLLVRFPLELLYAFVSPSNYIPLMLFVRLPQHFVGVGQNIAYANLQFMSTPKENSVCFLAFYQLTFTLGSVTGLLVGTGINAAMGGGAVSVFGRTLSGPPLTLIFSAFMELTAAILALSFRKRLESQT